MPRRLPEPHSCTHYQKFDQWKQFASSKAVNTLEETPGLGEHLEDQLRPLDVLCTITSSQIQEYAAEDCLFFSYVKEKTANYNIAEPRDRYGVTKFSKLLYQNSAEESVSEDELRFFICIEHTVPSEFRFRYLVYPHRVFHLIHFKRAISKFTSDDWVKIDPFRMMVKPESRRQGRQEPPWIPYGINYEPGSDDSLARLRQQHEQIVQNSVADTQSGFHFVPTRLLTFDPSDHKPLVRIVEARGLQQDDTKPHSNLAFAALSYCWGGDQKLKLTTASRGTLMGGIAFASLPRTFQDAVVVVSKMGLSYLWADALCIMQDDDDDKGRELAVMAKVYQNASFTIVASRAVSVEEGFLGPRLPFEDDCRTPFRLRVRYPPGFPHSQSGMDEATSDFSAICFPKMDMITSDDEGLEPVDPVFTRAWCFQESALSRTVIEFGLLTTQIRHVSLISGKPAVKYARDGWHRERRTSNIIVMHEILELMKNTGASLIDLWGTVVKYYSPLMLSLPEDRLPALSALAETFSPYFGGGDGDYLAGLWHSTLPQALLWAVDVAETDRDSRPSPGAQMHAPTWSWASVTSRINYFWVPLDISRKDTFKADLGVEILDYTPQLVLAKVVFGAVSRGDLRVRGRLRPVRMSLEDPYYQKFDHNLTIMTSLMGGVDFSDHRQQSSRVFTEGGHHSVTRGLHRLEYDHPEEAYRDQILCTQVYLDRREADVGAIIAESEGLYVLPIISGPSDDRELHVDELCWNFRMPKLRSIYGLVLVKGCDGTYSRVGVFRFSNEYSGTILDSQALELEDSAALYKDQHAWVQAGEVVEITIV
ncbi:hypothetical protein NUW58_g5625 [Xylaria curta]|uniref:Uncharacterized protein n=1 Tax=Xylaria curta TaxID=42375 RepID=A0ACC1P3R8_9PEZI|nr:hypothetical protein NUW58_g5625 [Xylaria curta]